MSFRSDILDGTDEVALELKLTSAISERWRALIQIQADLIRFGKTQGYTPAQISGAVQDLFDTFPQEWLAYLLASTPALANAISADITLSWLNIDVGGVSLRQRLINRLS